MTVRKQLVPIQFGGINTKVDPKQLNAGNLLTLTNGQFSKIGQINKRFGYNILNTTIEGGGNISAGVELATYKNELILFDGNNIYSYLTATGNWSNRGTAISVTTLDKDIIRQSSSQQLNPDMAELNGIEVFAWEDSRGGVRYSVVDVSTGAFSVSDASLNTSGQQPKCISFQNQIFIFYTDGNSTIFYQTINPFNPSVISAPIRLCTDALNISNGFPYDVSVIGTQMYIAYVGTSTPTTGAIQLFYLSNSFVKSAVIVVDNIIGYNTGFHGAISVVGDSGNNVWVSWSNGIVVYTANYSFTLVLILAPTFVDTASCVVITAIESPTPLTLQLFYEISKPLPYNEQIKYTTISQTGLIGTKQTILSVGIMTKPFKFNSNIYINAAYSSTLQATDFTFLIAKGNTILATPVIIAKETPGIGGGLQTNGMAPEIVLLSPGVFIFANNQAGKIISEANTVFTLLGVNSSKLTFIPSDNFVNTVQANTLLIVGGILQGYDGIMTTELGFHLYPENITYTAGGSGSLSTGTYQYMVEFEWTDNNGQIYRSAPSIQTSVVVSSGQNVVISGPTLRLTSKTTNISIVIYRTQANGTTFNRVTSTLSPLYNNTGVDTWTFTDTLSDASALSNELNYTTGGILANISPPANSIITTYNNRVFLAGMSDPLLMWYSQTVVDNSNSNTVPPQFAAELTISCDPRGGAITALGLLNQVLIIFKETNIFSLQGNGPDATGNNNDFQDPQLVTSDVGCINDNSVVIMPNGLMFQSAKGIYLLDQSLNLTYIGAPVEQYNNYNITSSSLNTTSNQVIFTTSNGIALVYDYFQQQWSTWDNHYALDGAIYNNNFTFITATGNVYEQNQSIFIDGSSPVYMSFTTPNLCFSNTAGQPGINSGIQGYQRVFRFFILGTYKSPHTLKVSIAYDYNDSYTQFAVVNPSANISTWGSDPNWGSGFFWGGGFQLYEYRIDLQIQKCTAIRLNISDSQSGIYGEGYAISSIVFEVGVLPGANRLPSTSTVGST